RRQSQYDTCRSKSLGYDSSSIDGDIGTLSVVGSYLFFELRHLGPSLFLQWRVLVRLAVLVKWWRNKELFHVRALGTPPFSLGRPKLFAMPLFKFRGGFPLQLLKEFVEIGNALVAHPV